MKARRVWWWAALVGVGCCERSGFWGPRDAFSPAQSRRPAILFNHVPSTGGSTWEIILARYACAHNLTVCPYTFDAGPVSGAGRPGSATPYCGGRDDVISSHMSVEGFRVLNRDRDALAAAGAIPGGTRYLRVTMVREPGGSLLAHFVQPQRPHHEIVRAVAAGDAAAVGAFEDALRGWLSDAAKRRGPYKYLGAQAQYLFRRGAGAFRSDASAGAALDAAYAYVGLMDRFDESVLGLFALIGAKAENYVYTNSARGKMDDGADRVGALRAEISAPGGWFRATLANLTLRVPFDDVYLYAAAESRFDARRPPPAGDLAAYAAARGREAPPAPASAWLPATGWTPPPYDAAAVDYGNVGDWRAYWTWPLSCLREPREIIRDACACDCADGHWAAWADLVAAKRATCCPGGEPRCASS